MAIWYLIVVTSSSCQVYEACMGVKVCLKLSSQNRTSFAIFKIIEHQNDKWIYTDPKMFFSRSNVYIFPTFYRSINQKLWIKLFRTVVEALQQTRLSLSGTSETDFENNPELKELLDTKLAKVKQQFENRLAERAKNVPGAGADEAAA